MFSVVLPEDSPSQPLKLLQHLIMLGRKWTLGSSLNLLNSLYL